MAMQSTTPLVPEIDFATDDVPHLHEILAGLRKAGPVVPVRFHDELAWLICGYEELMAALADEETFPSAAMYSLHAAPVMGKTLQCMGGEEHRINRALVSPAFLPSKIRSNIAELLEPVAHGLIDRLAHRGSGELIAEFCRLYPFTVITRLLGVPLDADKDILGWSLALVSYPWDPKTALAASAQFTEYLRPLVAERRMEPGEDLLSLLATAVVEGQRLTDEEIFSFVRLLFPAGSDTTYLALGSLIYAVLTHPEVRARVLADPEERRWAVEESLRWEAPVALLPRMCVRSTGWGGAEIPPGSPMLFGITAANRDPEVYPEPERFDLSRRARNLTFGHGEHFCLGSHLARAEMEVALGALLERLPGLRLVEPDAVRILGGVLRGPKELPVVFDRG
jgi:cytochrome P450